MLSGRARGILALVPVCVLLALTFCRAPAFGAIPNDPSFSLQWADDNFGQTVPAQESEEKLGPPAAGTPSDDEDVLEAWQKTTGSRAIVIGEVDTGVDYGHPDLAANIWSNPGSIGGCPAGTHGYNVLAHTCNPMDADTTYGGHGTHVAGIMGAVGNNGVGVTGINWQTTILPVKWLQNADFGETSALVEALQWLLAAKQEGVDIRVVNDSDTFFGTTPSAELSHEIEVLGQNDILFVTAAGNSGENDDQPASRRYPCGYDLPNEICVTASNDDDELPKWANYGPEVVNLAAPGVSIYSTLREGKYGYLSGGSMAAAQVSGAAALILSANPSLSAPQLKQAILTAVKPVPALKGMVESGGVLDIFAICKALPGCGKPLQSGPGGSQETPGPGTTPTASTPSTGPAPPAPRPGGAESGAVPIGHTLIVMHGKATIKLRCEARTACRGRTSLIVTLTNIRKKGAARKRKQAIGEASFSVSAGGVATVTIKLDALGSTLLKAAHGHLDADLTLRGAPPELAFAASERVRLLPRRARTAAAR